MRGHVAGQPKTPEVGIVQPLAGMFAVAVVLLVWTISASSSLERVMIVGPFEWGMISYRGAGAVAIGRVSWVNYARALVPKPYTEAAPFPVGGFRFGFDGGVFVFALPWWLVAAGVAAWVVPPMYRVLRRPDEEEWDGATCLECGYNLQASPERCPECGTPNTWRPRPKPPAPEAYRARLGRFLERVRNAGAAREKKKSARRWGRRARGGLG